MSRLCLILRTVQKGRLTVKIHENVSGPIDKRKIQLRSNFAAAAALTVITALLLMARAFVFGIKYYPQLDDYLQYFYYLQYHTFADLQAASGLLASRPLAGLADYFIWSRMPFAVDTVILCLMYAVSVILIRNALRRYFDLSSLFAVFMALMPLGTEAEYWISASTRVIPGTLVAALAELLFVKWLYSRGKSAASCLILSGVMMTASFWFYEQTGLLAAALLFVTACLERRRSGLRPLGILICIPAVAVAFCIPNLFIVEGSGYSSRVTEALTSTTPFMERLQTFAEQLKAVMLDGSFSIITKGFRRGASEIFSGGHTVWIILVILMCALLFFVSFIENPGAQISHRKKKIRNWDDTVGGSAAIVPEFMRFDSGISVKNIEEHKPLQGHGPLPALLTAAVLIAAPLAIFMLQGTPWFCFRNAAPSFAGFALLADFIITWISSAGGEMMRRIFPAALAALLALFFVICGVSETMDYKAVCDYDTAVSKAFAEERYTLRDAYDYDWEDPIGVIGVSYNDQADQNYFWHDHVLSCTESTWTLDALTRINVVPIYETEITGIQAGAPNDARIYHYLYYYDRSRKTLTRVRLVLQYRESAGSHYEVDDYNTGTRIGTLVISNGTQIFTKE